MKFWRNATIGLLFIILISIFFTYAVKYGWTGFLL